MSIQTELDRIISAVEAAHTKVLEKGGTTARPYLVGNLEAAIDSIPTGGLVLPKTTVEIDEDGGNAVIATEVVLIEGNTYIVTWNGVEYTCVAQEVVEAGEMVGIGVGDVAIATTGEPVTGEPFIIIDLTDEMAAINGGQTAIIAIDGSTSVTLSIRSDGGVAAVLQEKTVTPTTSRQNVTPDSGYDGLSKVTVNAMPTATQATPSISVDANGKITASATQSAGYVSAGTKSATKQLTTQAAKTVTPTESEQTAVASGRYTTGAIKVGAIPDGYLPYDEMSEQKALIEQITTALAGKAAGGGGKKTVTISVEIINGDGDMTCVLYRDATGATQLIHENGTIEALCGYVALGERVSEALSGSYFQADNTYEYFFYADGGSVQIEGIGGIGGIGGGA